MSEIFNRVIEQAAACLKSNAGENSPLLQSFAAFVKDVEAMFNARRFASLAEMRKHCISSSQSAQCEWAAIAKQASQSALVEHFLNLLVDSLPSLVFNAPSAAVKTEPDAAQKQSVGKPDLLGLADLGDVCKKVLQDLEKRSEHIMQLVNELPFADYKGNLPAPHTLTELKEALERCEYKTYSDFLRALDNVWTNVQLYYPHHTPAHKAAADMKELGVRLVSESSGASVSQLEAASAQAPAASAPQPGSTGLLGASGHEMPSLPHMSAIASDWFAQSLVNSFFPANSLHFPNPEASIFSLLMSQPDLGMFSSAPSTSAIASSMGESALNIAHGASCYDPAILNQFFNPLSHLFQPVLPAPDVSVPPPAPARPVPAAHPKFDPVDLPPLPSGANPLLEPDESVHVHLDMVGITATVHFKCQFNIDALRNYADKNDKTFVPSSDQKKSVENSVNFRISVPGAPLSAPVAGVLFVNGICKVSFARSDLTQLFDEIQRHIFSIDADAQLSGQRVIQDPGTDWTAHAEAPQAWRQWGSINYCLIKKQFQVGFKVMYVAALSLLRPLEKEGFIYDLRPAQSSGSGLFFRLRLRPLVDPLDGEISATIYHSGMVQVNGSKGCSEQQLQVACDGFYRYLQSCRGMIEPPDDEHADGNKRKKRAVAVVDPGAAAAASSFQL